MKHEIRYLKGTIDMSILLQSKNGAVRLEVWSNTYWVRNQSNRRSRIGSLLAINLKAIAWTSRVHTTVAISTAKKDFNTFPHTVQNNVQVPAMLADAGQPKKELALDNQENIETIRWTEEFHKLKNY